jgi:hypothetical protein
VEPDPTRPPRWFVRLPVAAGIAAVTALVFWPATAYGLVAWDDPLYVGLNGNVRDGLTAGGAFDAFVRIWAGYWIPLTWISFQLDVTLWGNDPRGFHVTNVLLHAANAALVYLLLVRLTGSPVRAAAVALLWALHPLRVESVAWVTERKDVLSGFFGLLGVWAYARYAEHRTNAWMGATFACFVLGMMAKPALITFPCCLLLLDAWPLGRLRRAADLAPLVREKAPLFLLVVAFAYLTVATQDEARLSLEQQPAPARVRTALVGYAMYLGKTVWPDGLAAFYPIPPDPRPLWQPAAAALVLAILTGAALAVRRRVPAVPVGWLWFVGTLFPTCGVLQSGPQEYADRFTYWPHIGLMLALVFLVGDWAARVRAGRLLAAVVFAVLLVASAVVTRETLPHWRDGVALWTRVVAVYPENVFAWGNLGEARALAGDREGARQAYEECLRLNPDSKGARGALRMLGFEPPP